MPIDLSRTIGNGSGDGSSGYSGYSGFGGSKKTITQSSHGLSVGNIVRLDEPTLLYVKAQADSASNAEVVGIVSEVINSNTFTIITQGWLEGLSGLNEGALHFLSATTPGLLVDTDVSTPGYISKPLLISTSTTAGYFFNWRGVYLSDTPVGSSGTSGFSGYSGPSGFSGYSGPSGFSGYSGPQGTSGFSGYSGPSGFSGYSGPSGFSGYSGPQGTSGFSGYSGPSGFSGYRGNWGGAITIHYKFSDQTSALFVNSGELAVNNATQSSATSMFISITDADGSGWASVLDTLADSTNSVKGHIRVSKLYNSTAWIIFTISAVATIAGSKRSLTVAVVSSSTANPFTLSDDLLFEFTRTGDSGFSGYSGPSGFSGYSGPSGFSGYSGISGFSGYSGRSGFSGYSGPSGFSGYSGPSGFSGYSGISGFSGYSGRSGFSGYSGLGTSGFSGYSGPTWAESSPSQITSNQNDYSFTAGTSLLRISADADGRTITGLSGGVAGKVLFIRNIGTKEIIFAHQNSSSSAANRLILPYPVDFVLRPSDCYEFIYDNTTQRWIMVGGYEAFLQDGRYCSFMFEEFVSGSLSTSGTIGTLGWTQTGAGSITRTNIDTSTLGRPGNIYLNGSAGQDKAIYHAQYGPDTYDQLIFSCSLRLPTAIADGTNDYYCIFGFHNFVGTSLTTLNTRLGLGFGSSCVAFEYDRTVSANWLCSTCSSFNGSGTQTSSGITASADTWTRFDIVYRPGASTPNAEYFIDGSSVVTQTTDLPDIPNGDLFQYGDFYYYRKLGAGARWFHLDYARIMNIRTTKR